MVEFYNTSVGSVGYLCSFYTGNQFRFTMSGANHVKKFQYRMKLWNSSTYAYQSRTKSAISSTVVEAAPSSLSPGVYHFEIRLENSCGWSQWFTYFVQYNDCNNQGMFRAYPNPTSNTLTIAAKESDEVSKSSAFNETNTLSSAMAISRNDNTFNFYDFSGNKVLSGQLQNITDVNVSKLKKGTYILEIIANGQEETHQIVIE
ncbi:T9SS type A sorting domain-containing protein [Hyunsoonleella ulvae]|uniref:T9SS type A sorting domain-containing protein n=1 Tax=Hyunsoonleella ulvae TaxID=2799948 RepID=UPI00193A01E6|nr:T9SS type A sorting domain-containing protein [Hyunsoonleella ulvae]